MADGAISYYVDHFVKTRVSKLTYGSRGYTVYDPSNLEHQKRPSFTSVAGDKVVTNVFSVMLSGVSFPLVLDLKR